MEAARSAYGWGVETDMGALFGGGGDIPEIQKVEPAAQATQTDLAVDNASQVEKLRRLRAVGKQKSIIAGELGAIPSGNLSVSHLGGY